MRELARRAVGASAASGALFAAEVRRGDLEQSEGTDRDDDHPDDVHVGIVQERPFVRNRANVLSSSGPDDVGAQSTLVAADSRSRLRRSMSSAAARSTSGRAIDSKIR
jgi:hypothetical protein